MIRRLRQQAYLNGSQSRQAAKLFGCCRVVYNDYLTEASRQHAANGKVDLSLAVKTVTTLAKKTPERAWLAEVSAVPLQQSVRNAQTAWNNYFASLNGSRRGPKMRRPVYKKRKSRQAATFTQAARFKVRVDGCSRWGFVTLPKLGDVKFRVTKSIDWDLVSSVTLTQDSTGSVWLSFVHDDTTVRQPAPDGSVVGIDLGLATLVAVVSSKGNGTRENVANPRFLKRKAKALARSQRNASRKKEGSKNYRKAQLKVAKLHRQVANCRKDAWDKFSRQIVRENQTVCLETLSIRGMGRTNKAKSVYDAGWGLGIRMLEYKAEEHGGVVARAGRWVPTSQPCSVCKHPGIGKLPLKVRAWTCVGCGARLDRDFNAAVNIIDAAGQAESLNACGADVRLRLAVADCGEAGTHRRDQALSVSGPVGISTL